MKTRAAVLWEIGTPWSVEEIDLDPPKAGEVLVKIHASGMCHSDEHIVTGDNPIIMPPLPIIGGHEGAGVVVEVGAGVTSVAPGDHVVFSFIPACSRCPSCSTGHQNLCDLGAGLGAGLQIADGTSRHHARGKDLTLMCLVGAFSEHSVVNEASVVKIDPNVPLDKACLVGCGVTTGWGSAVYAAETRAGETVAVVGCGGIGINAIQGARMAGATRIVGIDPVEFKREKAKEFGATHTFASIAEAIPALQAETWGQMCQRVIMSMGSGSGELMGQAMGLLGKRGRIVITNLHPTMEGGNSIPLLWLTVFEYQVVGSLFGSANPRSDINRLIGHYRNGDLNLDGLITKTYTLDQINDGYEDMRSGKNIRGVLLMT
ncbi:MAG: NDMA-dependent alcohol dehydrogenase [Acidimicrobiia bacterium]